MRVAHVCMDPGVHPGREKGAAVHLKAIRVAMRELGAEVFELDSADPVDVADRLRSLHKERPLDAVYERYSLGATAASEFSREVGIPHILEVNSPLADEALRHRGVLPPSEDDGSERLVFSSARLVVAVSSKVAEYAIRLGARPECTVTEPNGVDPRLFHPGRAKDLSDDSLLPQGKIILGAHGRLRPWHNLDFLAEATATVLDHGAPVHVLAVGAGDYEETLGRYLPSSAFTHVSWVPHEEVGCYVARFDILPLTYGEQDDYFSPLKLREAMAAGAVPVVPDVGDLASDVGEAGVVYEVGSRAGLQAALEGLIEDSSTRERLSRLAVARAQEQSWLAIARRTLEGALARAK